MGVKRQALERMCKEIFADFEPFEPNVDYILWLTSLNTFEEIQARTPPPPMYVKLREQEKI